MKHFILEQTCYACPEQYDVFLDGKQVGYLRLRHGYFRCDYLNCGGETVYGSYTEGDGMFDEEERFYHLNKAIVALAKKLELNDNYDLQITEE